MLRKCIFFLAIMIPLVIINLALPAHQTVIISAYCVRFNRSMLLCSSITFYSGFLQYSQAMTVVDPAVWQGGLHHSELLNFQQNSPFWRSLSDKPWKPVTFEPLNQFWQTRACSKALEKLYTMGISIGKGAHVHPLNLPMHKWSKFKSLQGVGDLMSLEQFL